jgi:hypothetical protein
MENSMTYVLKCTKKGHSASTYTFSQSLLVMGDFTVGIMFSQPLAGNGRLRRLRFPVSLGEIWTNYPA